ncbi:MAG TPA: hypothetical protein VFQ58_04785 [Flavisolibacter sp.]|jgi:hypothetical protein|nr:hypothetical protein [Flavisolibacter sp.]
MKRSTLQFLNLADLACFVKSASFGYLLNTMNITLTGRFSKEIIQSAFRSKASLVEPA